MNPFNFFKKPEPSWFPVGLLSSFPEVGYDDEDLLHQRDCNSQTKPGCKVFHVPKEDISQRKEVAVGADLKEVGEDDADLRNQALVFRHRGKMHAIDHVSLSYGPL